MHFDVSLGFCFYKTIAPLFVCGFFVMFGFFFFFLFFARSMSRLNCGFVCYKNQTPFFYVLGLLLWIKPTDNMGVSCNRYNKEPKVLFLEKEDDLEGSILNTEVLASVLHTKNEATTLNGEGRKGILPT